jgi:hypothetical protein
VAIFSTIATEFYAPSHNPLAKSNGEVSGELRAPGGALMATDLPSPQELADAIPRTGPRLKKPHLITGLCPMCERTGGGEFAVRAFMAGDDSAAARLSLAVVAALSAQRAKAPRRMATRPNPGAHCHGRA